MDKLNSLYSKIRLFSQKKMLMGQGDRILVALSGGPDSVFLLRYLLHNHHQIEAAHCNFHLRDEESMRDERFVRDLCTKHGVKLHLKDFNTEEVAQSHGISIEMAARDLRYEWFEKVRQENSCTCIAVAHHRDDNVETLLLNLIRGTGLKGLKGMQSKNGHIIRPLLCVSRKDIVNGLQEMGQDYVTDSTNAIDMYCRNKVRLDVMPLLKSINPAADENIARTMENLNEAYNVYSDCIDRSIGDCTEKDNDTLYIYIKRLLDYTSPLSVLHSILEQYGFNREQTKSILSCSDTGKTFDSPSHRLITDRDRFIVQPTESNQPQTEIPLSDYTGISLRTVSKDNLSIIKQSEYAYIDKAKVKGQLTLRTVRQGDSFIPFGMKGRKLISDYLTDIKLNLFEKRRQLVVCDGSDIVWVVGRRSSDIYKVDTTTNDIIILKLEQN